MPIPNKGHMVLVWRRSDWSRATSHVHQTNYVPWQRGASAFFPFSISLMQHTIWFAKQALTQKVLVTEITCSIIHSSPPRILRSILCVIVRVLENYQQANCLEMFLKGEVGRVYRGCACTPTVHACSEVMQTSICILLCLSLICLAMLR